ncbi:hypothetical protein [Tissierella creatinophila]|uniref:Uncharacterized protein n=1 Tax=Tissierella creatinophila DSM 6911 TaxID=1123403 RepID=A0A1U7M4H7_TISCR|nr:hypothetical protein [Tissierella creatinophila]OLS02217.1 hypothetical protein TICRE_18210 [Tissierella creatinophila DSM 6911]
MKKTILNLILFINIFFISYFFYDGNIRDTLNFYTFIGLFNLIIIGYTLSANTDIKFVNLFIYSTLSIFLGIIYNIYTMSEFNTDFKIIDLVIYYLIMIVMILTPYSYIKK